MWPAASWGATRRLGEGSREGRPVPRAQNWEVGGKLQCQAAQGKGGDLLRWACPGLVSLGLQFHFQLVRV